jgi:hypothetical protein
LLELDLGSLEAAEGVFSTTSRRDDPSA